MRLTRVTHHLRNDQVCEIRSNSDSLSCALDKFDGTVLPKNSRQ